MKLDKNKKLALFITIFSIITLAGLTYTYFAVSVSNTNNEKVQTQTATMSLEFDDNDNGVNANLNLGQSIVKKFTLENTGTVDAYGKINWYNLVNTYTQDSLTWTLEQSTTENGTYTTVGFGKVPTSSSETTNVLKNGLLVPVSTTYYYKLTITLNNLDINQSSDINATMHSQFSLETGYLTGVDTIQNLVAGEPINTTDVITKEVSLDNTKNAYVFRFNGIANLPEWEYDNLEDCQWDIEWLEEEFGSGINAVCQVNPSTEKYDIYVTGLSNKATNEDYIFDTLEDCEQAIEEQGFENTTCEMAEVEAPIDEPTGCTNTFAYDGTSDNNLRYVGNNPCNYVTFNGETAGWRIIGVMNNVDDGTGYLEPRLKLVRANSLGDYSWDTSDSSVNGGYGINDWTGADLKTELNGDYLNTSLQANTNWYNGQSNDQTGIYDYTKGLKASAQAQIGDAKWYLGGFTTANSYIELIPRTIYTKERGNSVFETMGNQICNDGFCPRSTEWIGKVALIYPSDFGFATLGGSTTTRSKCIENLTVYWPQTDTWTNRNYEDCAANDWIPYQWCLSPYSNCPYCVISVYLPDADSYIVTASTSQPIYPSVYLKANVKISGGNGSLNNPYTLE